MADGDSLYLISLQKIFPSTTSYLLPTGLLLYIILVVRNSHTYTITHTQELVDISHGVRRCDDDDDDDDSDDSDVLMGKKGSYHHKKDFQVVHPKSRQNEKSLSLSIPPDEQKEKKKASNVALLRLPT